VKKIIIGVVIILLLVLAYFIAFKSINLGSLKIDSINNIKSKSNNLDIKVKQAYELSEQTYPKELNNLEEAIKKLKTSKNQYDTKIAYSTSNGDTFGTYVRDYKIEALMVDLGRHSNQNNLKDLKLDLKTTNQRDVYDLDLTIVGTYEDVYDFIYSIENDDDLLFEISDLNIEPYMTKTTTTITSVSGQENSNETEYPHNLKEVITTAEITDSTSKPSDTSSNTNNNALLNIGNKNDTTQSKEDSTNTNITYDPKNVQAKFTIENITVSFK